MYRPFVVVVDEEKGAWWKLAEHLGRQLYRAVAGYHGKVLPVASFSSYPAVADGHHASKFRSDCKVVSDNHDGRVSCRVDRFQRGEDFVPPGGIELAGWLVDEQ